MPESRTGAGGFDCPVRLLFNLSADFGRRLGDNHAQFAEFAVYAATRANINNQPAYPSYASLGLDPTPTLKPFEP